MKRKEAQKKVEKKSIFLREQTKNQLLDQISREIREELKEDNEKKENQINRLISDLTLEGYKVEIICNIILTPIFQVYNLKTNN
ncbi:hypothetical protein ACSTS3_07965 [Aquimarina muelleri]|uniref:hypothetical protein n=1 Tax=Aquimarina muelleri TaxID=279356 RepID=UPI003F685181